MTFKWRKIKYAPKDDTVVDIYHPTMGRLTNMRRIVAGGRAFYTETQGGPCVVVGATHFMKVEPPEGEKA